MDKLENQASPNNNNVNQIGKRTNSVISKSITLKPNPNILEVIEEKSLNNVIIT